MTEIEIIKSPLGRGVFSKQKFEFELIKKLGSLFWRKLSRNLSDKTFLRLKFLVTYGKFPNLENPQMQSEKIAWRMLFDQRPIFKQTADKVAVHDYIKARGLARILPRRYFITEVMETVEVSSLPKSFIIKPSHSSGRVYVVHDKEKEDWNAVTQMCNEWLQSDYYRINREWQYKDIPRRIIIEEYLGIGKEIATDFKFQCFHGEPKFISVIAGRFSQNKTISRYDQNWNLIGGNYNYLSKNEIDQIHLREMLSIARKISAEFDYIRVDLLLHQGTKTYLSELTSTPRAGVGYKSDIQWENIGKYWQLDTSRKIANV